ncbi:MAG TPA: hypothetical protein VF695_11490 [Sphingomonas sp.]|jgi:hypothetical protein
MKPKAVAVGGALIVASFLNACAHLPAEQATAFQSLAKVNASALDDAIKRDEEERISLAQSMIREGMGKPILLNCESDAKEACVVTYALDDGTSRQFRPLAQNSKALLGSIVRYSDLMAQLCEAKDLDTIKTKSEAAAGSVAALAMLTGVGAIATPIMSATALLVNGSWREKRRSALLRVAQAADKPITVAADKLTAIAKRLATNAGLGAADRLDALQTRMNDDAGEVALLSAALHGAATPQPELRGRIELLQARRATDLAALVTAADEVNKARQPRSFESLKNGHAALIASLRDPKSSQEDTMKFISEFGVILDQLSSSKGGA